MRLRRPAVQRDSPRQQGEPRQPRQPQQWALHHIHRLKIDLRQLEGAVGRPHQPAGPGHQQRAETTQGKPQLAGGGAAGEKRRAERHDLRHHHQRADIGHHHRTGGGGQQQVDQQAVGLHLRVAMPANVKQRHRQRRQANGQQPQGIHAAHPHRQMEKLQHAAVDPIRHQQRGAAGNHQHGAGHRAADPGNGAAERFTHGKHKGQHGAGGVPCHRLID